MLVKEGVVVSDHPLEANRSPYNKSKGIHVRRFGLQSDTLAPQHIGIQLWTNKLRSIFKACGELSTQGISKTWSTKQSVKEQQSNRLMVLLETSSVLLKALALAI